MSLETCGGIGLCVTEHLNVVVAVVVITVALADQFENKLVLCGKFMRCKEYSRLLNSRELLL